MWSFGVVLFEMCSRRPLFMRDSSNDNITEGADQMRLCVWHTITDAELASVVAPDEMIRRHAGSSHDDAVYARRRVIDDACNLIRWCLKGDPAQRPTMSEVLAHRLLCPGAAGPEARREKYHAFLSHAQADASGTANALYFSYARLGVPCWIDMRQEKLTLEGMRQGVRDSDVFLLVLSKHVLARWFCQQEALEAIAAKKKVQILLEEDPRFLPFDVEAWEASRTAPPSDKDLRTSMGKGHG